MTGKIGSGAEPEPIQERPLATLHLKGKMLRGRFLDRRRKFIVRAKVGPRVVEAFLSHTGKLSDILQPNNIVLLRERTAGEKGHLPYEMLAVRQGRTWVCIRSQYANLLLEQAIRLGTYSVLPEGATLKREPRLPGGGRADLGWKSPTQALQGIVEVKSCSERRGDQAVFPDTITERGTRQARVLGNLARKGLDVRLCFVALRSDVREIGLARDIDPVFVRAAEWAREQGVKMEGFIGRVSASRSVLRITLGGKIPVYLARDSNRVVF